MIKALVAIRLKNIYSGIFRTSKKAKKRSIGMRALIGIFVVYIIACFFMMFGMMFEMLCEPYFSMGLGWLYFSTAGILAFALCFIGSVFAAQQQLFSAKDNELLLSMPIPPYAILLSRMLSLLALNYLFAAFVLLPAGAIWLINAPVRFIGIVSFVLCFLFLPLLSLALSSVFGWLLSWLETKLRRKNIVTLVFSLVFLGAYFYFYSRMQIYLNMMIASGETIASAVKRIIPPAYHMGIAIAEGNALSLALFILFCVAPMILVMYLLSRNFIRIATSSRSTVRFVYREKALSSSSTQAALFKKEMRHFLGNAMYILNAGLGAVFMVVIAVLLAINGEGVRTLMVMFEDMGLSTALIACVAIALCGAMVFISAPSISLEAKNLWIMRSIPVSSGDILLAKANTHIVFSVPFIIISAVITMFTARANVIESLLLFFLPFTVTCVIAYFGLIVNLRFPKFDWVSEVVAIKQSASSMITMFGSMAVLLIPILLYAFLLKDKISAEVYLGGWTVIFAVLSLILRRYIVTAGAAKFETL